MLLGEFRHRLDEKRRLSLPAKFRPVLGKAVVLTYGLEHTVWVWGLEAWGRVAEAVASLPMGNEASRRFARFLLGGAEEVEVDRSGRIVVPDRHVRYAGLVDNVVIVGVGQRLEIWGEAQWDAYRHRAEREADDIAGTLGSLGLL